MTGNYITGIDAMMLSQLPYKALGFETDGDYETWLDNILIPQIEAFIERYCGDLPSGFFKTGGVSVSDELHDYSKHFINLNCRPIISVSTVELNKAGCGETEVWTATTKYVKNLKSGSIRLVSVYPSCKDQGVRVSYTAGYAAMPPNIELVTSQLCSNVLHGTVQRKVSPTIRISDWAIRVVVPSSFTKELREMLKPYRQVRIGVG